MNIKIAHLRIFGKVIFFAFPVYIASNFSLLYLRTSQHLSSSESIFVYAISSISIDALTALPFYLAPGIFCLALAQHAENQTKNIPEIFE